MEIDLIFKIAAIGIIVSILNQVLSRSGREEQATMTSLAGLVVVLMMLTQKIADLFDLVMTTICNTKDMNDTDLFKVITNYAFKNNSLSVINALNKCKLSNKLAEYLKGFSQPKSKSTEMWKRLEKV